MAEEKKLADVEVFEEFKAVRHAPKSEPATEPKTPPTPAAAAAKSETVEDPEPSRAENQEKEEKPKQDRSLEGRLRKLRADGKHDEADKILRDAWTKESNARFEKLEKELQEVRTRKPAPEPVSAQPEQKPVTAATDDGPKVKDYDGSGPGKMYEDYLVDLARYRIVAEQRAEDSRKQAETTKQTVIRKLGEARATKPDFDQVAGSVNLGFNPQEAAKFFVGVENSGDVLYHLGSQPAEVARLNSLDVDSRLMALAVLGHTLKMPPPTLPPEKLKPAVSKAPPPGRQLTAMEPPEKRSTADAQTMEEFKRIRHGT